MVSRLENRTILYVENDYMIQSTVKSFMFGLGLDILIADDGSQAIKYIFDERLFIAALVTDIDLGNGVNGWEVARCARLQTPDLPVVYTSNVSKGEGRSDIVPASKVCMKPVRPSHILEALLSLIAERDVIDRTAPLGLATDGFENIAPYPGGPSIH